MDNISDIRTSDDIQLLVNSFYDRVKNDSLLAPVFAHVNWPTHLPIMYSFWGSMLLGESTYRGNPLQKHFPLQINSQHFDKWLELWKETVDDNFVGVVADEAKLRGGAIAEVFQFRMGLKHKA